MKKVIVFMSAILVYASDFQNSPFGTRAFGFSEAYVGLGDDIESIGYNPAGLAFMKHPVIFVEVGSLHIGLTDGSQLYNTSFAFAYPKEKYGIFGIAWQTFSLKDWYQEHILTLTWSKWLSDKFSVGLSLKPMFQKYELDDYMRNDPVFDYGRRDSLFVLSLDQGLSLKIYEGIYLGVALINLNQPNIGYLVTEQLPLKIKIGLGIKYKRPNIGVEITSQKNYQALNIGGEYQFTKNLRLFGGVGIGQNYYFNLSLGGSFEIKRIKMSYAFSIPKISKNYGTHKFSLSWGFGPPPTEIFSAEEYRALIKERDNLKKKINELKAKTIPSAENEKLKSKIKALEAELKRKETEFKEKVKLLEEKLAASGISSEESYKMKLKIASLEKQLKEAESIKKEKERLEKELDKLQKILKKKPKDVEMPSESEEIKKLKAKVKDLEERLLTSEIMLEKKEDELKSALEKIKSLTRVKVTMKKPKVRTHTVKPGETLMSIAEKYYGDAKKWKVIYEANKDKVKKGRVVPGQVLKIP